MKLSIWKMAPVAVLLLGASQAMAFELNCVRDLRAVDGDLVKIKLVIGDNGASTATIEQKSDGPAASHAETTTLRALTCKRESGPFQNITCTGPYQLTVSDMEAVAPGGMGFTHIVTVQTSFENKSFQFGGQASATLPNSCSWN